MGQLLFRATETAEGGKILLLLGVLLRARIVRIKIEHRRFVDLEQVDALRAPRKPSLVIPSMIAPETSGYSALTLRTAFCF